MNRWAIFNRPLNADLKRDFSATAEADCPRREDGLGKNRMAQSEPGGIVIPSKEELLAAARRRGILPAGELWLDYQDDVDTLYISLKEKTNPTHSESDIEDLVVFDYE